MVITCPNCDAKYSIDQSSLKGKGARVTCKSCKTVFPIYLDVETEKESEAPKEEEIPSLEELDVYALNFKDVGLKSWKVKIKMGLVYDFSDYKTLSKYIREGKVDKNDKLSSDDGTTWTVINEIDDLEKHFCLVYLEKKKQKQEGGDAPKAQPKPPKEKVPTLGAGLSDLASVLAEAEAEVDGKPSSRARQKIRPNTQKRPTKRPTSKKKEKETPPEPKKKGSNTFVLLVLLLLVSVGVFLYLNNIEKTAELEREKQVSEQNVEVAEQDRDALNQKIEEKMEKVRRDREAAAEEKRKKKREEAASKTPDQLEAELRLKEQQKEQNKPKKKTLEELKKEGEQAMRTSKWSDAEKIYTEIVAQRPTAKNQVLLGRSLYKQKKFAKAKSILNVAAQGNVEGYKWLGYIAHEEGDDAGANGFFRTYLKSNPRDAALIQRLMNGE